MNFNDASKHLPGEIIRMILKYLETGEKAETENPVFVMEGFCLYCAIITLELKKEDFYFYNDEIRNSEIKANLLTMKKHKSKSEAELNSFISENNLFDIRNSLFHGNFEVDEIDGKGCFVLKPLRPRNPSSKPIYLSYQDIYPVLYKKLLEVKEKFEKLDDTEPLDNLYFKLFAYCYTEMGMFFSDKMAWDFQSREILEENIHMIAQNLMHTLECVYNQNQIYPTLKNYPEKQENLCIYRNSTAHAHTIMEGKDFKFIDVNEKNGTTRERQISYNDYLEEMFDITAISTLSQIEESLKFVNELEEKYPDLPAIKNIKTRLENMYNIIFENEKKFYKSESEEDEKE